MIQFKKKRDIKKWKQFNDFKYASLINKDKFKKKDL